jgi:hypothetical protein
MLALSPCHTFRMGTVSSQRQRLSHPHGRNIHALCSPLGVLLLLLIKEEPRKVCACPRSATTQSFMAVLVKFCLHFLCTLKLIHRLLSVGFERCLPQSKSLSVPFVRCHGITQG